MNQDPGFFTPKSKSVNWAAIVPSNNCICPPPPTYLLLPHFFTVTHFRIRDINYQVLTYRVIIKKKLHSLSLQANYTNRATASCRRS
jgi:hypothetical protein